MTWLNMIVKTWLFIDRGTKRTRRETCSSRSPTLIKVICSLTSRPHPLRRWQSWHCLLSESSGRSQAGLPGKDFKIKQATEETQDQDPNLSEISVHLAGSCHHLPAPHSPTWSLTDDDEDSQTGKQSSSSSRQSVVRHSTSCSAHAHGACATDRPMPPHSLSDSSLLGVITETHRPSSPMARRTSLPHTLTTNPSNVIHF